jgi:predicted ATPase
MGGVGKTRLALHIASELGVDFTDGICFISLANISDPDLFIPTLAKALDLPEVRDRPVVEHLQAFLHARRLLLLLDNFEQLVVAAPQLAEMLAICPHLKVLVTSRCVLRLRCENEYRLSPLALPDLAHFPTHEGLSQIAAVALFLHQIRKTVPDFQLTAANARSIAEVCVRLDGLPLALELAAARIKVLSPQALLARLGRRLPLLTKGAQDAPERQQTLRETIAWSYRLLTSQQQRLFQRLSVFVGGCTLEAIEKVCGAGEEQVVDAVTCLLDQSLLQVERLKEEAPRFLMLETIREYALECLEGSDEKEAIRQAHAQYYLALAEEAEPRLLSAEQPGWLRRLERELDNMRAALHWFHSRRDGEAACRLVGALWAFWLLSRLSEGSRLVSQTLALCEEQITSVAPWAKARAVHAAAYVAHCQDHPLSVQEEYGRTYLDLMRSAGDTHGIGLALNFLGLLALQTNDMAALATLTEESVLLLRTQEDRWSLAVALSLAASACFWRGEHAHARLLAGEGLALFQQVEEPVMTMRLLYTLISIDEDGAVVARFYKEIFRLCLYRILHQQQQSFS